MSKNIFQAIWTAGGFALAALLMANLMYLHQTDIDSIRCIALIHQSPY